MFRRVSPLLLLSLLLLGCPPSKEAGRTAAPSPLPAPRRPAAPDLILRVASLNLALHTRRIEREDIERFAALLRKDSVDILSLQGVTRYPGVTTRADVLDELSARAEMRSVFGETISVSGRQSGNAVFSVYAIQSSQNTPYAGSAGANFESALQAVVDCGVRPVVVVSTLLPERATLDEQSTSAHALSTFHSLYIGSPVIVAGNLPRSDGLRAIASYQEVPGVRMEEAPRIWYSGDPALSFIRSRTENSVFGPLVIAQFGLFHPTGR
jgi:endonuclease/exonuclease/phosphatase family metal-dependent hydrolase